MSLRGRKGEEGREKMTGEDRERGREDEARKGERRK